MNLWRLRKEEDDGHSPKNKKEENGLGLLLCSSLYSQGSVDRSHSDIGVRQFIIQKQARKTLQRPSHGNAKIFGEAACDAEDLLANMEQGPSDPLQDSLLPLMKALIGDSLLTHSVDGVRVSVAYCLTEIMRISAPLEPFNDDQMKVIFELIVEAFSKLSRASAQYYEKALSILETVARVKACLLMLDLQCHALVVQMFQSFWAFIRSDPTDDILWAVEQIMTDVLSESEDISSGLLNPLLASVLKGNKNVAPSCWKLGERVITKCAAKLAPVLHGAVQSSGTTVDDYSPVVASVCENEPTMENNHANGSSQPVVADGFVSFPGKVVPDLDGARGLNTSDAAALVFPNDVVPVAKTSTDKADSADSKGPTKLEIDLEALPKKRERKPNKLMDPAEGYDLSRLYVEPQKSGHRRVLVNGCDLSVAPKNPSRKRRMQQMVNVEPDAGESTVARDEEEAPVPGDLTGKKSKLSIVGGRMSSFNNAVSEGSGLPGRRLVGQKIKVWWTLDETFYYGVVQSYDPFRKRHKVLYDDGDMETLNLEKERWEYIKDDLPAEHRQEADHPKPNASSVICKKSESPRKLLIQQNVERSDLDTKLPIKQNVERAEPSSRFPQNVGGDESSDDESSEDNVYEIKFRSKDVQLKCPSSSSSDDSTPDASPPRHITAKSKDVRLQSTSDDSTPEGSPPRPWGLWQSRFWRH